VGVYIAISDSKISQLIQYGKNNHRTANSNIDKIIKKFESEGYEVVKSKEKIDYSKI
jgi:malate/lactate dehydrogenase